jgi:hypothetical protein
LALENLVKLSQPATIVRSQNSTRAKNNLRISDLFN